MRKVASILMAIFLVVSFMSTSVMADAGKGQKYYLKKFKKKFGMNGTKFASLHSQSEWEELMKNNYSGFISEFSAKYPKAKSFLHKPKSLKYIKHVLDFAHKFANDSGEVPTC